jgi:hypothetical protein
MRFRFVVMTGGGLAVLAALYFTDPDGGITTGMLLLSIVTPILAVGFAHLVRKALMDYPAADMERLFLKAGEHPTGAGLALIAVAIILYGLLGLFGRGAHAQDVRLYIPPAALQHQATLRKEWQAHWPDHPAPEILPALIEHESCLGLKHPRCWNSLSRLKSAREEGAGLGQLTRAYRIDGTLRFDALAEMRTQHPALQELDWSNVYQRPDLQLRALVLKSRDNFQALRQVSDPWARLSFADAAYNGGLAGVQLERRACALKAGCDPQQWFGHVENVCLKGRVALYGGRSACDINRHHVVDVMTVRAEKYRGWL